MCVAAEEESAMRIRDHLAGERRSFSFEFFRPANGFGFASELIAYIRDGWGGRHDFCLGGACYPEGHTECPDKEQDLRNLTAKVAAGADFLVTQLFFDNEHYFDFVRRARAAGITLTIIPGIMPVTNVAQIERFTGMCGATIPPALRDLLDRCPDDAAVVEAGIGYAAEQCRDLLAR